ncbi:hypothetical protein [Photobacterium profundum]|uniref:hypothetical protein n=1 Tax=Photobacterium profundum TaxID=74109 RepID=UPI00059C77C5|nr:hypothetical protein [Photobacterium profundum]
MANRIKLGIAFFLISFLPSSIIVYAQYMILGFNCDSKFGCSGSFTIMVMAIAYLSLLSALAVFLSDFIRVYKRGCGLSGSGKVIVLIFGFILGLSINLVFYFLGDLTLKYLVILYFLVPFTFSYLVSFWKN